MMKESPVTYPTLRPLYLEWVISKNDPTLARTTFAAISQIPPYNIDLYRKMINTETLRKPIDVKYVRDLYERACLYFGSNKSGMVFSTFHFKIIDVYSSMRFQFFRSVDGLRQIRKAIR